MKLRHLLAALMRTVHYKRPWAVRSAFAAARPLRQSRAGRLGAPRRGISSLAEQEPIHLPRLTQEQEELSHGSSSRAPSTGAPVLFATLPGRLWPRKPGKPRNTSPRSQIEPIETWRPVPNMCVGGQTSFDPQKE